MNYIENMKMIKNGANEAEIYNLARERMNAKRIATMLDAGAPNAAKALYESRKRASKLTALFRSAGNGNA